MSGGAEFRIEGLDEFYKWLKGAGQSAVSDMMKRILESLGEALLEYAQSALKMTARPHARFSMQSKPVTRGKNKGQSRNYLKYIGSASASSVDTGRLWGSFSRGASGNVWVANMQGGNFRLVVGSNLKYARYINDGFSRKKHWVPGIADGNGIFRYQPGAKTGIMVQAGSFAGIKFFDVAFSEVERLMPGVIEYELRRLVNEFNG